MNKTEKIINAASLVVAGVFGALWYATHTQSEILLDALKEPIKEEKPYQPPESSTLDTLPPIYSAFAKQYNLELVAASNNYKVPAELILGAIAEENARRTLLEDWKDSVALRWNACVPSSFEVDPSLGIGQVNVSTAEYLRTRYSLPPLTSKLIEKELLIPKKSIDYIAMTLADIIHRPNRTTVGPIFDNAHLIAIIGTEYVRGPTDSSLASAEPTSAGIFYLWAVSTIPPTLVSGENASITRKQRKAMQKYAITKQYKD